MFNENMDAVGILSCLPSPEDERQTVIYVKLSKYISWIIEAKLEEEERQPYNGPYRIIRLLPSVKVT